MWEGVNLIRDDQFFLSSKPASLKAKQRPKDMFALFAGTFKFTNRNNLNIQLFVSEKVT